MSTMHPAAGERSPIGDGREDDGQASSASNFLVPSSRQPPTAASSPSPSPPRPSRLTSNQAPTNLQRKSGRPSPSTQVVLRVCPPRRQGPAPAPPTLNPRTEIEPASEPYPGRKFARWRLPINSTDEISALHGLPDPFVDNSETHARRSPSQSAMAAAARRIVAASRSHGNARLSTGRTKSVRHSTHKRSPESSSSPSPPATPTPRRFPGFAWSIRSLAGTMSRRDLHRSIGSTSIEEDRATDDESPVHGTVLDDEQVESPPAATPRPRRVPTFLGRHRTPSRESFVTAPSRQISYGSLQELRASAYEVSRRRASSINSGAVSLPHSPSSGTVDLAVAPPAIVESRSLTFNSGEERRRFLATTLREPLYLDIARPQNYDLIFPPSPRIQRSPGRGHALPPAKTLSYQQLREASPRPAMLHATPLVYLSRSVSDPHPHRPRQGPAEARRWPLFVPERILRRDGSAVELDLSPRRHSSAGLRSDVERRVNQLTPIFDDGEVAQLSSQVSRSDDEAEGDGEYDARNSSENERRQNRNVVALVAGAADSQPLAEDEKGDDLHDRDPARAAASQVYRARYQRASDESPSLHSFGSGQADIDPEERLRGRTYFDRREAAMLERLAASALGSSPLHLRALMVPVGETDTDRRLHPSVSEPVMLIGSVLIAPILLEHRLGRVGRRAGPGGQSEGQRRREVGAVVEESSEEAGVSTTAAENETSRGAGEALVTFGLTVADPRSTLEDGWEEQVHPMLLAAGAVARRRRRHGLLLEDDEQGEERDEQRSGDFSAGEVPAPIFHGSPSSFERHRWHQGTNRTLSRLRAWIRRRVGR